MTDVEYTEAEAKLAVLAVRRDAASRASLDALKAWYSQEWRVAPERKERQLRALVEARLKDRLAGERRRQEATP